MRRRGLMGAEDGCLLYTRTVSATCNAALLALGEHTVTYDPSTDLDEGTMAAARVLTTGDAATASAAGTIASAAVRNVLKQYVTITNDASFGGPHRPAHGAGDAVWGTVLLFPASMTAALLGETCGQKFNGWDVDGIAGFTFQGYVSACLVPALGVWCVGMTLVQTEV